ncbi:MAG: nitrile hydratase subunit beta [Pseudomonadales bacterium]|jgi:nitrile hydratase
MDGIHDLGGKHGYGKVAIEVDEPVFHSRWEAAVFSMTTLGAATGAWNNTDRFRHAVERIDPVAYLSHGYYGRWLGGIENLLVEADVLSRDSISNKALEIGGKAHDLIASRPNPVPDVITSDSAGKTALRESTRMAKFLVGEQVRTSTEVKSSHTRLPAYARGKLGTIVMSHDAWVFPDTNAHGEGENPQYLYTVQFTGQELWGGGDQNIKVSLDLFEPYLYRENEE